MMQERIEGVWYYREKYKENYILVLKILLISNIR